MVKTGRFYGWILVAGLGALYFVSGGFAFYGPGVINAYMAKSLGMDRSTLGLGFSVIALVMGLSGPLVAFFLAKPPNMIVRNYVEDKS